MKTTRSLLRAILGMIALILQGLLLSTPAQAAQDPQCFPYYRYEDEFLDKLRVDFLSPSTAYVHCDLNNVAYLTVKAFLYLKDLPILDESHPFDQRLLKRSPYGYFRDKIKAVSFESDSASCDVDVAAAYYNVHTPGVLHVCADPANSVRFHDVVRTAGMLLHEARHSESPAHEMCRHGVLAGVGVEACDRSYEAGGAWALETEFYLKLVRTPGVGAQVRERARGMAVEILVTAFNQPPLGIREGVVLKRNDGTVLFTDGKSREVMLPKLPQDAVIATWVPPVASVSLNIFRAESARPLTYYFSSRKMVEQATIGIDENHAQLPVAQRHQLRDIFRTDNYWCWLYARSMVCWSTATDAVEIALNFEATGVAYGRDSGVMPSGPMIRSSDGNYFALPEDIDVLRRWGLSGLRPVDNELDAIAAIKAGTSGRNEEFVLFPDNRLFLYRFGRRVKEFEPGGKYERIYGPVNWSRRLEEV